MEGRTCPAATLDTDPNSVFRVAEIDFRLVKLLAVSGCRTRGDDALQPETGLFAEVEPAFAVSAGVRHVDGNEFAQPARKSPSRGRISGQPACKRHAAGPNHAPVELGLRVAVTRIELALRSRLADLAIEERL